jgi:hypothetical protein
VLNLKHFKAIIKNKTENIKNNGIVTNDPIKDTIFFD